MYTDLTQDNITADTGSTAVDDLDDLDDLYYLDFYLSEVWIVRGVAFSYFPIFSI